MALTRRDMLRMGIIGSAATLAPRFARRAAAQSNTTNTVGVSAYTTQPWQDELKTSVDSNGTSSCSGRSPACTFGHDHHP